LSFETRHSQGITKKLKNHYRAVGKQVFSLHCSEDAFVGIFGHYITRYSPCGSFYICHFKGENAVETIAQLLDNVNWCERDYGNGQQSFVRLYVPEEPNMPCNKKNGEQQKKNQGRRY
jgi:hypothetical protein